MTALFFYGTLLHRPMLDLLTGGTAAGSPREAVLPGHRVLRQAEGVLPVLVAEDGHDARGEVWTDLSEYMIERLDSYELPFGYERRPVTLVVEGLPMGAHAYYPPESLRPAAEDWSLQTWVKEHLPLPMRRAAEIGAQDPPRLGDAALRERPMIDHRAAASLRAAQSAPTGRRHHAEEGDFVLRRTRPPAGDFFLFEGLEVDHRRFDGERNQGLPREVMVGADASLVLPYDEARDRVLLVEQFRPGPARRGDPQPWILEPVAGLVDAGETPEEAARREAMEEAGLELRDLVPMYAGYACPGNATDHFYAYLALCDLPDGFATSGGLEEEKEDIRLHVLPTDEALALLDTGEANAVPLISMLLWLDRWRAKRR